MKEQYSAGSASLLDSLSGLMLLFVISLLIVLFLVLGLGSSSTRIYQPSGELSLG